MAKKNNIIQFANKKDDTASPEETEFVSERFSKETVELMRKNSSLSDEEFRNTLKVLDELPFDQMQDTDTDSDPLPEAYSRRQLNDLYRQIPIEDKTACTLRKYFCAFANLYGAIELEEAYNIISEQNKGLISEKDFYEFAKIAQHEIDPFFILSPECFYLDVADCELKEYQILDVDMIFGNTDEYFELAKTQHNKPRFIPLKTKLLKYAKAEYYEETPETIAFSEFFRSIFTKYNKPNCEIVLQYIIQCTRYCIFELEHVLEELKSKKIKLNNQELDELCRLFIDLNNNMRKQSNNGFTPRELMDIMNVRPENIKPQFGERIKNNLLDGKITLDDLASTIIHSNGLSNEMKKSHLSALIDLADELELDLTQEQAPQTQQASVKCGRNDPCPCGSGKKYKNCCGRNYQN